MGIWLVADPTVTLIDVLANTSHASPDQHYERRFCPRDDVCVACSTISKRKIIPMCQYPLNLGLCDNECQDVCGSWFKCWVWAELGGGHEGSRGEGLRQRSGVFGL